MKSHLLMKASKWSPRFQPEKEREKKRLGGGEGGGAAGTNFF